MSWGVATQNGVSVSLASIVSLSCGATEFSPASLFTSGVAGAWYDPSDVLLNWRTNLLTYSQEFDNAAWTKTNATVTANAAVAPDGTLTADKLIESAGVTRGRTQQAIATAVGNTISVYAKAAEWNRVSIGITNGTGLWGVSTFNLSNGTIEGGATYGGDAVDTPVITAVGNGWYRCSVRVAAGISTPVIMPFNQSGDPVNPSPALTGDGTSGVYIWGAQLELGSTATTYQAITTPEQTYLLYDPQPVLYQDSAGTTPVTAVEQPVGLMLDKSQGLVLGSELVTGAASAYTGNGTVATVGDTITATCTTNGIYGITWLSTLVSNSWVLLTVEVVTNSASKSLLVFPNGNTTALAGGTTTGSKSFIAFAPTATGGTRCPIFYINGLVGESFSIRLASIKSYAGNHASQATAASRPVLRARYNSLLYSETFSNAVWQSASSGTAAAGVKTPNFGTAPDGTQTACRIQLDVSAGSTGNQSQIYQNYACAVGNLTYQCYVKTNDGSTKTICPFTATGAVLTVTGTWQLFTFTRSSGAASDNFQFILIKGTTSDTADLLVWHPQSNPGSSAGTYQRIAAATDYATAGFLPYLALDGTDDGLATANIDFTSTNKVSIFSGFTKLADSATGTLVELSSSYSANTGAFAVQIPQGASLPDMVFSSNGTTFRSVVSAIGAAPVTRVTTNLADIAAPSILSRVDGVAGTPVTTSQGTGNYGTYPLYIGRRAGTSLPLNGRIYQLVICGKTASASEIASTEAYVATKTGVVI